jgi:4-diphosphocytidyl-2-C-methyl-D-erythritol kinase
LSILTERAYAKLNLALHVRGKLPDGRHRIETIFAFCEDGDELTAEPADALSLTVTGPFADALDANDENLVLKAAHALSDASNVKAGAALTLNKCLPIASGIGGGSADAAAALRLLTRMWSLDESIAGAVAPVIGADVAACLRSRISRGDGAGDELSPVNLRGFTLSEKPVLLVNPRISLPTSEVFAVWDGVDRGPLGNWWEGRNDLEAPARALVPEIREVLDWLARHTRGDADVRMSGSGATCFALLDSIGDRDAAAAQIPDHWWHLATRLR